MRKLFVLPVVLVGLIFGTDAFSAAARNARGTSGASANTATSETKAPVSARAAVRGTAVKSGSNSTAKNTGTVAARAAKKTATVQNTASAKAPVAARAATSQKVIQTGSKVSTATENTVVSQECQDAFFGCMDAFCMLDNVSGGRCQCSDRSAELDKVLDDILKLDEQTYIMATEGVERIQMGENESEIMARAKAAADKVTEDKSQDSKKKARTLDLSAWNSNVFDDMDDDIFDTKVLDGADAVKDKTGDALYKTASERCSTRIPAQCRSSSSMLQMIYAQKIKSDCTAYENSLKQQKSASAQKLQTAQKALRDAALEQFQNENKYDAGQCTARFSECMRGKDVCDSDYTGCVVLAAKENAKGAKAKQTTIKGELTNITLAATTMEQLLAKKEICMHVTRQCVNANKNDAVWNLFLRDAAPALKSAEEIAEQKLRMNCIPTLADCFQKACKSTIDPNDPDGSYDMCLANPETYKSLCKVQLEPCLSATGGSYDKPTSSTLWNSLLNALAAMKVDACTKQIKECLTADTACGENYSGCVGLSTDDIVGLCPSTKLTACQNGDFSAEEYYGDANYDDPVLNYVNKIADGIKLNIENNMLLTCQDALNQAMINICGDTEECSQLKIGNLTANMNVQTCNKGANDKLICKTDVIGFEDKDLKSYGAFAKLTDKIDVAKIEYKPEDATFVIKDGSSITSPEYSFENTKNAVSALNIAFDNAIKTIETEGTVYYCMNGRKLPARSTAEETEANDTGKGEFPMLTSNVRNLIAARLLTSLANQTREMEEGFDNKIKEVSVTISDRFAKIAEGDSAEIDKQNQKACKDMEQLDVHRIKKSSSHIADNYIRELTDKEASYDSATGICTIRTVKYKCTKYLSPSCKTFDDGTVLNTETIQMAKTK